MFVFVLVCVVKESLSSEPQRRNFPSDWESKKLRVNVYVNSEVHYIGSLYITFKHFGFIAIKLIVLMQTIFSSTL